MKRALIVWGGWPGHDPEECAGIVSDMLAGEGFATVVENTTEAFTDPELGAFDLITPIVTMSKIEKEEINGLDAAVRGGTGLGGFHGGMGDAFRDEVSYQFIVGGQWVAHPGKIIDYVVTVTRPDDPVMEGIGDFPYRSEQYYMHVDPNNEVLATTRFSDEHCDWIGGHECPVVWKRRHGRGRVFYSSLGHRATEFAVPQMKEILRRGLLWAAEGKAAAG